MGLKQELERQGKELGLSAAQMRVLSIDPFFVGTEKDKEDGAWAAKLWDEMMAQRKKPIHIRGFHYWIQSKHKVKPDGKKYAQEDAAKDWLYLMHSVQMARYLNFGEWKNLIDRKHPDPVDFAKYEVKTGYELPEDPKVANIVKDLWAQMPQAINEAILKRMPKLHTDFYQKYHCEVWCEKGSMGFVIEPQCKKYGAVYQPLVGQASVEKVVLSCQRAIQAAGAGKKIRIFYISDWDRYGWSMIPAVSRKIEFFTKNENVDIKLTRLALNDDQIRKHKLPKAPKLGEAVVELDALEAIVPGALGKIVAEALKPFYDGEGPRLASEENRRIRQKIDKVLREQVLPKLQDALEGIDLKELGIADMDLSTFVDQSFKVPEPKDIAEGEGMFEWEYDSGRDFWEQTKIHNEYKKTRVEEEM